MVKRDARRYERAARPRDERSDLGRWSIEQLEAASLTGALLINDIVYAELSVRYSRIEELDAFIDGSGLVLIPFPRAALFLAAKVFTQYRRAGGSRTGVLPDFLIGAQAAIEKRPVLTRDVGRYRSYFPAVESISPS